MASRRDQLHSYQFGVQRLMSALVMRDPYAETSPFRRVSGAVFAGFMITLLVVSGFGIYGLFRPGGNVSWKSDGTVVVEKETGAVYVYRGQDHLLHPVLNLTSALLIAGRHGSGDVRSVSRGSLKGVPRGNTLGIVDAPASLPTASNMVGAPWTLCSRPGHDSAGHTTTSTELVVGRRPRGGRGLDDAGLLLSDSGSGRTYLVWHRHRYEIRESGTVLGALNWQQYRQRMKVGPAWLSALPAGAAIGPPPVTSRGEVSSALPDTRVGEVLVVHGAGPAQYYLAMSTRLARVTPLQAQIMLGDPDTAAAYPGSEPHPVELNPARANALRTDSSLLRHGDTAPPVDPPTLVDPEAGRSVCASYPDAGSDPTVRYGARAPGSHRGASTPKSTTGGAALVDRVVVPPGHAAVVRAVVGPGASAGALNLVTDLGYRYPVPSREVLDSLGYSSVHVTTLPGSLVARIPAGPVLDPDRARHPVLVGGR